jgi:hypothetical protein
MMSIRVWCGILASAVVLVVGQVRADGKKIAADKLPTAVTAAVRDRLPGAELTGAEEENEGGKLVYDLELRHNGRKYEMDVLPDGTILEIEKQLLGKEIPGSVKKAVEGKYPNATIQEVMEVNKVRGKKETRDHFEVVLVTVGQKKLEVEISLDGKVQNGEAAK